MPSGPVLLAYDGSDAARWAVRKAGALLGPRAALVVTVWEPGLAYAALEPPTIGIGAPTFVDVQTATELDDAVRQHAERVVRDGAVVAHAAGFTATAQVASDRSDVAGTLVGLAREHDAQAIVLGSHGHAGLRDRLLGSTSMAVVHAADCPVVIVRAHT